MRIGFMREMTPGERRIALTPQVAGKLIKLGADVVLESGAGASLGLSDAEFTALGATIADRQAILTGVDILLCVRRPDPAELRQVKAGTLVVGLFDPMFHPDGVQASIDQGLSVISMEYIPRTTRAQKMDVLSSQANLAGYVAVILGAERLDRILPMMMTPAGTIAPANVFIIGAGVAGLQAIATAHRLGARVTAFDTRPVVKEQVQSLGAKFLEIDLGETGQTAGGYATQLTPEQLALQKAGQAKQCAQSDLVITTAQLFGRKAPILIDAPMVAGMKPGSVIVDLAVETGGNVEGVRLNEEVITDNGVRLIGLGNLPGRVATHATQMYAANLYNLLSEYWDKEQGFVLNLEDDILTSCVIVHQGSLRNDQIRGALESLATPAGKGA